jgi:hypothetical protein
MTDEKRLMRLTLSVACLLFATPVCAQGAAPTDAEVAAAAADCEAHKRVEPLSLEVPAKPARGIYWDSGWEHCREVEAEKRERIAKQRTQQSPEASSGVAARLKGNR